MRASDSEYRLEKQATTITHDSPRDQAVIQRSINSFNTKPVKRLLCSKGLWFDSLWSVLEQAAEPRINPEAAHLASE